MARLTQSAMESFMRRMTQGRQYHDDWKNARPVRRFVRIPREFLCEVVVDGLSVEGRTIDLNEGGISVLLPHPLFANLDSATVILTGPDGSLVRLSGRVIRQRQIGIGEVLVGIQLADLPRGTAEKLLDKCASDSLVQREPSLACTRAATPPLRWMRLLAGFPAPSVQDRRRIPRLPIHTVCTILNDEQQSRKGLTHDLSYTGLSAWFSNLPHGPLFGTLLQVKFVTLKAMPIDIVHRGSDTLIRFRIEHIQEGQRRWRDLHHTYWQHLS